MRLFAIAVTLLVLATGAGAGAADRSAAVAAYHDLLNRQCARKHLELLTPGDLSYLIEEFEEKLPPRKLHNIARVSAADKSCADIVAGASCGNVTFLQAARQSGELMAFSRLACSQPVICRTMPCSLDYKRR